MQRTFSSRILIVEDSAVVRRVAETILQRLECKLDFACNGREAHIMASHKKYDLILMDVELPLLNGIQATRLIRTNPPPFCDVPIVAVTANGDRISCLEAGMSEFYTKPAYYRAIVSKWLPQIAHRRRP